MPQNENLVDVSLIRKMLYEDEAYVKEFSVASVQSFSEFKKHFKESLLAREMDELRRAGHKIKPVALMLNLTPVVEMYETSKTYIQENRPTQELADLAKQMDAYCERIIAEFQELT